MGIIEGIEEALKPARRKCKFCDILEQLKPDEAKALLAARAQHGLSYAKMAGILADNGHPLMGSTIGKHYEEKHEPAV